MAALPEKDSYFEGSLPPHNLGEVENAVRIFVEQQVRAGRCVALITSGGTIVPLEKNTVRFLDNFSTGNRGAASAEYFLSLGYAVIFLHRATSSTPFARHFQNWVSPNVDGMLLDAFRLNEKGDICLEPKERAVGSHLQEVLKAYKWITEEETYFPIGFTTVNEYLWYLRQICSCLRPMGRKAILYLAAAVSDYYIPHDRTPEHKIQSSAGPLQLNLQPVPKLLGQVKTWTPSAFSISFKLETDRDILLRKAKTASSHYGMNLVVANLLHERRDRVFLVTSDDFRVIEREFHKEDIEESLVEAVTAAHFEYIAEESAAGGSAVVSLRSLPHTRSRSSGTVSRALRYLQENREVITVHLVEIVTTVTATLLFSLLKDRYLKSQ